MFSGGLPGRAADGVDLVGVRRRWCLFSWLFGTLVDLHVKGIGPLAPHRSFIPSCLQTIMGPVSEGFERPHDLCRWLFGPTCKVAQQHIDGSSFLWGHSGHETTVGSIVQGRKGRTSS